MSSKDAPPPYEPTPPAPTPVHPGPPAPTPGAIIVPVDHEERGLSDGRKSMFLFMVFYAVVFVTLEFVFSLVTYPGFADDPRFENNPFAALMISAGCGIVTILGFIYRLVNNLGDNDLPWWFQTVIGTVTLMALGVWMWEIAILDSADANILKDDYVKIYKLLLAMVCIFGIIFCFLFCA